MKKAKTTTEKKSRQEIISELTDGLEESIKDFINIKTSLPRCHSSIIIL